MLKLYDLKQFAKIFSKYDIISKQFNIWGYIYPFVEILLGIMIIYDYKSIRVIKILLILMIISIISVILSMINGLKIRCGCLGSFFHMPLSYTTLSENIMMIIMSINYLVVNTIK